jgi:hypothetical protein
MKAFSDDRVGGSRISVQNALILQRWVLQAIECCLLALVRSLCPM